MPSNIRGSFSRSNPAYGKCSYQFGYLMTTLIFGFTAFAGPITSDCAASRMSPSRNSLQLCVPLAARSDSVFVVVKKKSSRMSSSKSEAV